MHPITALPLSLVMLLSASRAAAGPLFTVNSVVDAPGGGSLTNGVCETATGNKICTLRAAVMEANHVVGGGATVVIPAQIYFLTRPPTNGDETNGDLDLLAPMTIVGAGPSATVIDANFFDRVFDVANVPVTLRGLSAQNGASGTFEDGGGIRNGGELTLENVAVVNCHAGDFGGGISNSGSLTIRHGIVSGSSPGDTGGGVHNALGATLRIEDSLLSGNRAESGGGIANLGSATIERTSFFGNASNTTGPAGFGGGAISNMGSLVLSNSTVAQNTAFQHGGGIYAQGGSAELVHVTITGNRADHSGASLLGGGIAVPFSGGNVLLRNSIVAENLSGAGTAPSECSGDDILSQDYNVIGVPSTCSLTGVTTNVNTTNAPFFLNSPHLSGGFAQDVVSEWGATIPLASCVDPIGAPLLIDGRGYSRGSTGLCDIGAVETSGRYAPASPLHLELLRNGGAVRNELGLATIDTSPADAPYWAITGFGETMVQVAYGSPGFPARSDAPPGSGSYFFAGGTEFDPASVQLIDISAAAAKIDAGTLPYRLSGAFGGTGLDDDRAFLLVIFREADGDSILEVTIGGFDAADRGNVTKFMRDSQRGLVPVGTRFLDVYMFAELANGPYNHGYADALSVSVPEPSGALLACGALATLGVVSRGRRQSTSATHSTSTRKSGCGSADANAVRAG